jgi:hypothetical protein
MGHFNRRRLIAGAAASGLLFTRAVHADTSALPAELDAYFAAVLRDGDPAFRTELGRPVTTTPPVLPSC